MSKSIKLSAVFFDRDNTLTLDEGYTWKVEDLRWLPGATQAVKMLNDRGVYVFLITNQAGVAKGKFKERDVIKFHSHMEEELANIGAHFDDILYCPHHIDGVISAYSKTCSYRKPQPGMILHLLKKWKLDPLNCILFGDSETDIDAGLAAGVSSFQFKGGNVLEFVKSHISFEGYSTIPTQD